MEKLTEVRNQESKNANSDKRKLGTALRSYFGNGALIKQMVPKMISNHVGEFVLKFN